MPALIRQTRPLIKVNAQLIADSLKTSMTISQAVLLKDVKFPYPASKRLPKAVSGRAPKPKTLAL